MIFELEMIFCVEIDFLVKKWLNHIFEFKMIFWSFEKRSISNQSCNDWVDWVAETKMVELIDC